MKRTLVLATIALSLYSMGPAMADSMLGDRQVHVSRHDGPVESRIRKTDGPRRPSHSTAPEVPRRYQPITHGFDLQPTQSELPTPDVSAGDAKVVDELYRKLMQEERARYPDLFRRPASQPAAASPTSPKDSR